MAEDVAAAGVDAVVASLASELDVRTAAVADPDVKTWIRKRDEMVRWDVVVEVEDGIADEQANWGRVGWP